MVNQHQSCSVHLCLARYATKLYTKIYILTDVNKHMFIYLYRYEYAHTYSNRAVSLLTLGKLSNLLSFTFLICKIWIMMFT